MKAPGALLRRLALVCAALVLSSHDVAHAAPGSDYHGFYLLSFDRYGQLLSPYERDLAIAELAANPGIERILIVAYGWSNDGEASVGAYEELLGDLLARLGTSVDARKTAVFGIGWDSSQTGFRKLANDLVPLPVLADAVAFAPDRLLFPLSFWSKAAMADRIGFGGLRQTLNQIFAVAYPEGRDHPDLFLIGHSFGTRILSGLLKNDLGGLPVGTEPFASLPHVRGALWMQPALVLPNLPTDPPFPLIITQNEHDHANGLVFPLGNVVMNAWSFTAFEGLIQNRLFRVVEETVDTAKDTVLGAGSQILDAARGGGGQPQPLRDGPSSQEGADRSMQAPPASESESDSNGTAPSTAAASPPLAPLSSPSASAPQRFQALRTRAISATRRTSAELLSIPAAIAFTVVATPLQYVYTQWVGFSSRPVDHVMDSLAQLPGIEVGVDLAGRAFDREVPWGRTSKGIFSLGALHESAGRLVAPALLAPTPSTSIPFSALFDETVMQPCGFPRCEGTVFIDLSDQIGAGLFGDLRQPWLRYSVGWFDVLGMHSYSRGPEISLLLSRLIFGPSGGAIDGADGGAPLRIESD